MADSRIPGLVLLQKADIDKAADQILIYDNSADATKRAYANFFEDSGLIYSPDASEADQGATAAAGGVTIYDALQAIGTSAPGKIVLRHTGEAATTDYAVDTNIDMTSYPLVFIQFEPGARLTRVSAETVTFYSPASIACQPTQQITAVDMIRFAIGGTVYPQWWGAVADLSQDSSAAFSAAANACMGTLMVPAGQYYVSGITIERGIRVIGEGAGTVTENNSGTTIVQYTEDADILTFDTQDEVHVAGIRFLAKTATSTGAAITIKDSTPTVGVTNMYSTISDIRTDAMYIGVNLESALLTDITGCVFWNCQDGGAGVKVNNTYNKDQGDQSISRCTFSGSAVGIHWVGGGGTRIVNNKFFNAKAIYADMTTPTGQTATGQFLVANNSIDIANSGSSFVPVELVMTSTSVENFLNVVICNNMFIAYSGYTNMVDVLKVSGYSATYRIRQVNISGNNIVINGAFSGSGAVSLHHVSEFVISGNLILATTSGTNGIYLDDLVEKGKVIANYVNGFTNALYDPDTSANVSYTP